MSGLCDGPPPEFGKITIGEKNAELCHEKANVSRGRKANRTKFPEYRRYDLTGAALKSPQSLAHDLNKAAFIPAEDGIMLRIWQDWETAGLKGALEHVLESTEAPNAIKKISSAILKLLTIIKSSQNRVFSQNEIPDAVVIETYSLIPKWSECIIKTFGAHPHIHSFAVAYKDDVVKIFSANRLSDFEPILKDKKQKDVGCLAFRPLSAAHIAVGCKTGIVFWLLDPNTSGIRPGANQHRFLTNSSHLPVTSLTWSGDGHLLASGSPKDSSIMIWDVLSQRSTALRRLGPGMGFISWSPSQDCLFTSSTNDMFRIWETNTWTCEKWSNLNGRCQVACWSPCGKYILFTVENEASLYYLYFQKNQAMQKTTSSANGVAVKCFDFSEYSWETELEDVSAGGMVQSMAWDPTGSRLAVLFKDSKNPSMVQRHIGLFRTMTDPVFEILPSGFISGDLDEFPIAISFLPNFERGALLMVCWSSGMVSQIPLLFHTTRVAAIPNQDVLTSSPSSSDAQIPSNATPETLQSIAE